MATDTSTLSRWVWHSTPDSIERGAVSVLAVFEVGAALILYFGVAHLFGFWLPILVSAIAAPLVLLRSYKSVDLAGKIWGSYKEVSNYNRFLHNRIISIMLVGIATVILAFLWWPAICLNDDFLGLSGFQQFYVFSTFALILGVAFTIAAVGSIAVLVEFSKIIRVISSAVGVLSRPIFRVFPLSFWLILLGIFLSIPILFFAMVIGLGFVLGIYLRTLSIRIASVLPYFTEGMRAVPANWRRVVLSEDIWHIPELLPGVSEDVMNISLKFVWKSTESKNKFSYIASFALSAFLVAIWFGPTFLWRFALKSTFWLYGPLLFIAYPSNEGRKEWLSRQSTAWERDQRKLALILLVISIITLTGFSRLWKEWEMASEAGVAFFFTWALALDWASLLTQPWRILSLLNLIIALGIFYWRDHLRARIRNDEPVAMSGWPVGWLVRLVKVQVVVFVAYWAVSLWNLVLYMDATGKVVLPW